MTNKTQPTQASVDEFISALEHPRRARDAAQLLALFREVCATQGVMWGPAIIGFGEYTYPLANGKQERFFRTGFSPRKQNLSVYIGAGIQRRPDLAERLGKYKHKNSCVYINTLADVDLDVLKGLIVADIQEMAERYPEPQG
ncbi:DUF1801 domain-containing protein [Aestuariibacter halophilus]|uniref:DUF1801 domain-containing protein n=1 Tax=Fluctibacter halophilus TaxID=226011 RepID=A0ABS8G6M0_9ALTE|nr:DUF1801 domain-containing protein [Aestuariibacter halophilus]MCC2615339.1 DUF1801 domain-containing protein [Aestuariibacter halophilus]